MWKRDVDRRQDRDDVILGGTNGSFRWEGAMVVGRDIFIGEMGRLEESSKVRRSFVVKGKVRDRVRKGLEERDDVTVGCDVRNRRAAF